MALAITWSNETGGSTLSARLNFVGNTATNIDAADFRVLNQSNQEQSGWTISPSASSTSANPGFVTITATPPSGASGMFKFRLMPFTIREGSDQHPGFPTSNIDSALAGVYGVATASWSNTAISLNRRRIVADLTFLLYEFSNLESADMDIINASDAVQSGWNINPRYSHAGTDFPIEVSALIPSNIHGSFRFRLNAETVRSDGSPTDNAPAAAVTSGSIAIDNRPAVATWSAPTLVSGGQSITANLTFSRSGVTGLTAADIYITDDGNNLESGWTITVAKPNPRENEAVAITATIPRNKHGSYKFNIGQNTVRPDGAAEDNTPNAIVSSATIAIDTRPIIATAAWGMATGGGRITSSLTFSGADVTNIEQADFEVLDADNSDAVVTGWAVAPPADASASDGVGVEITANPPLKQSDGSFTNGMFKIRLKANSVRSDGSTVDNAPATAATTTAVSVDLTPTVATAAWSEVEGGIGQRVRLEGNLTFSGADVGGITAEDFQILNDSDVVQSGWSFFPSRQAVAMGNAIKLSVIPPALVTNGMFRIQLKALSVDSDGGSNNAPENAVTSDAVLINNIPRVVTTQWTAESGGSTLSGIMNFGLPPLPPGQSSQNSIDVGQISASYFDIIDNNGRVQKRYDRTATDEENATAWKLILSDYSASSGSCINVIATPPSDPTADPPISTDGLYKLRLKANTLNSDGGTNNAPIANVDFDDPVSVKKGLVVPRPVENVRQFEALGEFEVKLDLVRATQFDQNNTITVLGVNLTAIIQTDQELIRLEDTSFLQLFGQRIITLQIINNDLGTGDYLIESTGERLVGQQITGQITSRLGFWRIFGIEQVGNQYQLLRCEGRDLIPLN